MAAQPRLIIFASGTSTGGGSGFQELVRQSRTSILQAEIVAVVSNCTSGGVKAIADTYGVPFVHFSSPWTTEAYRQILATHRAEWVALSGWLKPVRGLDPRRTFNIHPGPLPQFGGKGMYGRHLHEAVLYAFRHGELTTTAVTMHFVTDFDTAGDYDDGPVIFRYPILIDPNDTPDSLGTRVNSYEHAWQAFITNLVIHRQIAWDGRDPESLTRPSWYPFA
jgi:phosphoribosylglycinamide formyltransferase-1